MILKAEDQDAPEISTVVNDENHIYFYGEITSSSALALIRKLHEVDAQLVRESIQRGADKSPYPIKLHINSPGGNVFPALAIVDHLKSLSTTVHTVAEGEVSSAATLLYIVGKVRWAFPSAFFLIHPLETWFIGTHTQIQDLVKMQEKLLGRMIDLYFQHTTMKVEQIKEKLQRDSWMDVEEAGELGMVDLIKMPT